jgi:hypothetical protein
VGTIRHRRFTPREHRFEYPLFMALLDVDRLRDAMSVSTFTSYNRWNWAAYHERDHLRDPSRPLRDRLRDSALAAGCVLPDGPVHLLTHLRYAGYVFNPISLFYCYDTGGELRLVLAEVSNTYGGRREYWLQPREGCEGFRAVAAKSLYVSPFMQQNADYEFVLTAPAASLVAHMNVVSREGAGPGRDRLFDATLTLDHRPWTARNLRHVLLRFPLMTASVITAIYWQALRLRLRGLKIFPFPQGGPV